MRGRERCPHRDRGLGTDQGSLSGGGRRSYVPGRVETHGVVQQVALPGQLANGLAELRQDLGSLIPDFWCTELRQADPPLRLPAAELPGDLVDAPLQRLAQAEVVRMQRQHLPGLDGVPQPLAERDLDPLQPPVEAVLCEP